eukprot:g6847.t1
MPISPGASEINLRRNDLGLQPTPLSGRCAGRLQRRQCGRLPERPSWRKAAAAAPDTWLHLGRHGRSTTVQKVSLQSSSLDVLSEPVELPAVHSEVSEDGALAFVHFKHRGRHHVYNLSAFSVYSRDALALVQTANGTELLKTRPRSFRSRTPGAWATAWLQEGTVSGLFEDGGRIMRIELAEHKRDLSESAPAPAPHDQGQRGPTRRSGRIRTGQRQRVVAEASFVYEKQLNIVLKIGYMKLYTSPVGAPQFAGSCSDKETLLDQLKGDARAHPFTGCLAESETRRAGRVSYKEKLTEFSKQVEKAWLVFAHELGHNFGGAHSFENGKGKTGGIMDYGDGKLGGVYQFNTRYRRQEMCQQMNSAVNRCSGKFQELDDPISTTTSGPISTTSTTTIQTPYRVTTVGCECMKFWSLWGSPKPCENYCCNPDNDPRGPWCFVWTRPGGIQASVPHQGYQCYRYREAMEVAPVELINFEPVNGGKDQACRGKASSDNLKAYFDVANAQDLQDCASKCEMHGACRGIEYHPSGRCEIWTRPGGIQASEPHESYQCHRYLVPPGFEPVDGGRDRACRGGSKKDNLQRHFRIFHGTQTLKECFAHCAEEAMHGKLGLGADGTPLIKPTPLPSNSETMDFKQKAHMGQCYNAAKSDSVPLDRDAPDTRPEVCKLRHRNYPKDLRTASIVIVFHNEVASVLLRSVHSVLNQSPQDLLHEVILVDDASVPDPGRFTEEPSSECFVSRNLLSFALIFSKFFWKNILQCVRSGGKDCRNHC